MAATVAANICENKYLQEIEQAKKVNNKLLYLVNKYRYAYLKSLELILFYEKILKRNCEETENVEWCDSLKRKRQCDPSMLDEELFLRKRFKANILRGISVEVVPYKQDSSEEKSAKNSVSSNEKAYSTTEHLGGDLNKADYINLDVLDFSAYAEDDDGSIKYYGKENEIEKLKMNAQQKTTKESDTLKSAYTNTHPSKKAPLMTQSKYEKPALKSAYSRISPSIYKGGTPIDKQPKGPSIPGNSNLMNKSTYQRSFSKNPEMDKKGAIRNSMLDKRDLNKSVYAPNTANKQMPHINKTAHMGQKNLPNKPNNISDSIYIGSKFMPNKYNTNAPDKLSISTLNKNPIKPKIIEPMKKNAPNKPNNLQNSMYVKNPKLANTANQRVYVNKAMPQRNVGRENPSVINLNLKGKEGAITEPIDELTTNTRLKTDPNLSNLEKKNNTVTSQENNVLETNKMKEAREQLLEELQVQIGNTCPVTEQKDGEKLKEKNTRDHMYQSLLPLTMSYIDALIENDEKIKNEKRQDNKEEIVVLKNESPLEIQKEKNKQNEQNKFVIHNLTEEEYKWIIEYRTKGTKPDFVIEKKEKLINEQSKKPDDEPNNQKETKPIDKNLKDNQKNEFAFIQEKETLKNVRIGGSSVFGKFRGAISEINHKEENLKANVDVNSNANKENTDIQNVIKKEAIESVQNNPIDEKQKKEDASNMKASHLEQTEKSTEHRNAILHINQEIIQKKNQRDHEGKIKEERINERYMNEDISNIKENELLHSKINSLVATHVKNSNLKNSSLPFTLKNNTCVKSEQNTITKGVSNNRATLYIGLNATYEYMSLDSIDMNKILSEGLLSYKNVQESYIECSANTKDMIAYNEIMQTEKKTFYFSIEQIEGNKKAITQTKIEIFFKSGDEIKQEILSIAGVSIFQNINVTVHPTKSLINDEKLVTWFTKKKKEKHKAHFAELDSSQSTMHKKVTKRPSNMGTFYQPLIIMLSSLKRHETHTNLKKIIRSLILCTSGSSALEKIVHTIPEENSKNHIIWKESLHNLEVFVGHRKSSILKKFVEFCVNYSEDEVVDEEIELTQREEENIYFSEPFSDFGMHTRNNPDSYNLNACDYIQGGTKMDNYLNNSFSSSTTAATATTSTSRYTSNNGGANYAYKKKENDEENLYEDEQFCLFIGTIPNAYKRFQYLLLIDNFNFIYEDLMTHINNKLNSISLIINKHVQLKQLFCNILFLCNWLNEPRNYQWFLWNDILKKIEKLCGFQENGRISKERSIMLLLAEHTGLIFTDNELNNLKKYSKFHMKDLYEKSIDFINSYFELKNQINSPEFKKNCCISLDGINQLQEDKFLEKIQNFVDSNYKKMLYIIWNLDLLIKKYLILIVWLGDIRPFYPLFSYLDTHKKIIYSHDLFVNIVFFFESYNKYVNMIKKQNDETFTNKRLVKNKHPADDDYTFSVQPFYNGDENKMCSNSITTTTTTSLCMEQTKEVNFSSVSKTAKTVVKEEGGNNWVSSNEATDYINYSRTQKNETQSIKNQFNSLCANGKAIASHQKKTLYLSDDKPIKNNIFETNHECITTFPELKKRKSLTNTVNYACEIKRKSVEIEQINLIRRKSSFSETSVEFELSD